MATQRHSTLQTTQFHAVLLDLSAAFDIVDHDRLLAVLNSRIGITGAALSWFESYLKGRTQHVAIKNVQSSMTKLKCGVPQGSVLGPVLFTTYLLPLGDILRKFGVQFHCCADDIQLYIPFNQNDNSCLGSIEVYLKFKFGWRPTFSNSMQKQGKSEGFESCDRPIVRKPPSWVKIGDVLYCVTLKFDGWPWKTIGHFLLCSFKLWATFHSHWWIQTGLTVRKRLIWVKFNDF